MFPLSILQIDTPREAISNRRLDLCTVVLDFQRTMKSPLDEIGPLNSSCPIYVLKRSISDSLWGGGGRFVRLCKTEVDVGWSLTDIDVKHYGNRSVKKEATYIRIV